MIAFHCNAMQLNSFDSVDIRFTNHTNDLICPIISNLFFIFINWSVESDERWWRCRRLLGELGTILFKQSYTNFSKSELLQTETVMLFVFTAHDIYALHTKTLDCSLSIFMYFCSRYFTIYSNNKKYNYNLIRWCNDAIVNEISLFLNGKFLCQFCFSAYTKANNLSIELNALVTVQTAT